MRHLALFILGGSLLACTRPAEVYGTVKGSEMKTESAIFVSTPESEAISMLLSDWDDACELSRAHAEMKEGRSLWFLFFRNDGAENPKAMPIVPGDYPVVPFHDFLELEGQLPAQGAVGQFSMNDRECESVLSATERIFRSGTVHIARVSKGSELEGSFNISVGEQGDHLTGNFRADFCDIPDDRPSRTCR